MPIWARAKGQTEITQVSQETEVRIPWQSYLKLLILGPVSIWCFFVVGWLVWLTVAVNRDGMRVGKWVTERWWPHLTHWWMVPFILCFAWIGSAPTWATIYNFTLEIIAKTRPAYGEWKAENGLWHPFVNWRRRRIERAKLDEVYNEQFGRPGLLSWGRNDDREDED